MQAIIGNIMSKVRINEVDVRFAADVSSAVFSSVHCLHHRHHGNHHAL
ncbi:MAG: hypothetical protein ACNI27_17115 [Desulfovibrio sp.]